MSALCLGTMNFGPRTAEADAHRILDAALDAGIDFVKTEHLYTFDGVPGFSLGQGQ